MDSASDVDQILQIIPDVNNESARDIRNIDPFIVVMYL